MTSREMVRRCCRVPRDEWCMVGRVFEENGKGEDSWKFPGWGLTNSPAGQ